MKFEKKASRLSILVVLLFALQSTVLIHTATAWKGMRMPELFVKGRYLMAKDINGNDSIVNLHGYGQTYSPWFNEQGSKWSNYSVFDCTYYNKNLIKTIERKGWKVNWLRLHMDPYWSNTPGVSTSGEEDIHAFDFERFKTYLDKVFIPMAKTAIENGLYVVMRPPGVCPQNLKPGDEYQEYLLKVWTYVANHAYLKNNPYIMYELANEPVNMWDGSQYTNGWTDGAYKYHTQYFQKIVDAIRDLGANNILWVPGLCWQQNYKGFIKYPIKGDNIGLAVHCYPGWYGSDSEADNGSVEQGIVTKGNTYFDFQEGWDNSIKDVAQKWPILVTEMDWAPKKYNCSWGKCNTGVLGGTGFGANFKYIMDKTGNVSWMLFTGPEWLAKYNDTAADGNTFLTDPEACVRPIYRWFQEYAEPGWEFHDNLKESFMENSSKELVFGETGVSFNPAISEGGMLVKNTDNTFTFTAGKSTFGGWKFEGGMDMSAYKYLVINLAEKNTTGKWYVRIFDQEDLTGARYNRQITSSVSRIVITLPSAKTTASVALDLSHICVVGLYNTAYSNIKVKDAYLTNNTDYSKPATGIDDIWIPEDDTPLFRMNNAVYNVQGQLIKNMKKGELYIINGKKYLNR